MVFRGGEKYGFLIWFARNRLENDFSRGGEHLTEKIEFSIRGVFELLLDVYLSTLFSNWHLILLAVKQPRVARQLFHGFRLNEKKKKNELQ